MIYNINIEPSGDLPRILIIKTDNIKSAVAELSKSYKILAVYHNPDIEDVLVVQPDGDNDLYEVICNYTAADGTNSRRVEYVIAPDVVSAMNYICDAYVILSADLYTEHVKFIKM